MKQLSFFILSFLFSTSLFAQAPLPESNKTVHNRQNWFTYFGQYKLHPNWGIHADVQFRMDEDVKVAKQNLLRAGLIRYLNPNLNFTSGYAFINSDASGTGRASTETYLTEHRIWEQLIYNQKLASLNMTHRLRLEQRFVEKILIAPDDRNYTDYVYGNRVRYFNRTIFDFTKTPDAQNVFYVALQDEVFLNVASPDINKNVFDQNRFLLAFGVFHDKKTRLELGYMNQFLNPYNRRNAMNHILHVSVLQTLNFGAAL